MKHKKITLTVAALTAFLLLIGITGAYLMGVSGKQINSIPIGYDSVEIIEEFIPPTKQQAITEYKKKVQVRNNGSVPCFVRVYVEFSDSRISDISSFSSDSQNYYTASRDTSNKDAYVNHLPDKWVFIPDNDNGVLAGYFYYTEPIAPESVSSAIFEYVKTDYTDYKDSEFAPIQYEIIVYAESVQIIGTSGTDFSAIEDGWKSAWLEFLNDN